MRTNGGSYFLLELHSSEDRKSEREQRLNRKDRNATSSCKSLTHKEVGRKTVAQHAQRGELMEEKAKVREDNVKKLTDEV